VAVPTDEDLLLALRSGQAESLGVLVARWEGPLFRFVSRLVDRPDDARDVCQETFLRILDKADAFRDGARFSTWMYQIALNLCRDQTRRKRRWGRLMIAEPAAGVETPRFREIADVLGVPESTVKSRMYAGLDAMRMSLAGLGIP
jgi:DNA-directed RNA polymerase specialized sigma24 family protein